MRFSCIFCKAPYTLSVKLSDFTVWRNTWRKNWINCAVLTGNSAGLRIVLSSRLSHTKLRSSLRESHSFLILPADTTMASSQGSFVSSNSFSRWASRDIFLFKYHFLLRILRSLFFFSDNIMADVTSKQQTTTSFLFTIVTRARRHTELTNLTGNLYCAKEHQFSISCSFFFFTQLNFTVELRVYGALKVLVDCRAVCAVGPTGSCRMVARSVSRQLNSGNKNSFTICTYRSDVTVTALPISSLKK